ncbi:DegQ family serine endoprotease [Afifella pfennigii]|uniref:DegQ family serine endoprotease n=1 Tax=Afifella pfennigii TaxID=209897 RepID=UPI000556ED05|nr:DegQ family serine endoprotease [Afifella pfennigii]
MPKLRSKLRYAALFILPLAVAGPVALFGIGDSGRGSNPAVAQEVPQSRAEIGLSFAPVVKRAAPAVVNVYAKQIVRSRPSPFADDPFFRHFFGDGFGSPYGLPRERAHSSLGSGVIVDASGLVLTNYHVIRGADEMKVALSDGREFEAKRLLADEQSDLAVLKIEDGEEDFPTIEFADSDALEVGDLVLAIGNPFGVGQTVTSGIVSAVARTDVGINDMSFFIQTDAAINPGNSGGALVDVEGRLAGINTAIFSRSGGSNGIGFAIPSNMVQSVVAQALAGGTEVVRPWVGATFQKVTPDIAASLDLPRPTGALVVSVEKGSPAAKAGLKPGDLVLAAGGREISSPRALEYRLAIRGVGQKEELRIMRRGREEALVLALQAAPEGVLADERLIDGYSPLSGATVANLSPRLSDRLRLPSEKKGVAVTEVKPGSPADQLGLAPGDVVVAVQGRRIGSARDLARLTAERQRLWRLTIDRRGRVSQLVIGG